MKNRDDIIFLVFYRQKTDLEKGSSNREKSDGLVLEKKKAAVI